MKYSTRELHNRQNKIRYNWGFQFSLWCALLWGVCYQSLGLMISQDGFLQTLSGERNPYAAGTVIAMVLTMMIAMISVIWVSLTSNSSEIIRAVFPFNRMSRYYLITAVMGGIAAWATYITAGLLDTLFAVAGVMFYPVVGSVIARVWLKEKISFKGKIGMAIILLGCLVLYIPAIYHGALLAGYFLGLLTGIGWGVEGPVASRIVDVTDSITGVAVRFIYEAALWLVILIIVCFISPNGIIMIYMKALLGDPFAMLMLFIIALCLTFNYFSWYRAFTLIGIFRGLVISDVSGFVVVGVSMILATSMPTWPEVIAALIMMFGVFFIYLEGSGGISVMRNVNLTPMTQKARCASSSRHLTIKAKTLHFIEKHGPVWDFEVANVLSEHFTDDKSRLRCRDMVRTYMIEAAAAGLIVSNEDAVDESGHFQKGKLLSRYQITEYGFQQLFISGKQNRWCLFPKIFFIGKGR